MINNFIKVEGNEHLIPQNGRDFLCLYNCGTVCRFYSDPEPDSYLTHFAYLYE